jgi:hypothetical protein
MVLFTSKEYGAEEKPKAEWGMYIHIVIVAAVEAKGRQPQFDCEGHLP